MVAQIPKSSFITNVAGILNRTDKRTKIANLQEAASHGGMIRTKYLDGATPMVLPPAVIVLLAAPGMWKNYPARSQLLKAMFECHATSITGIDINYTLNFADVLAGHDGQQLATPTRTDRQQPNPSFTWPELTGNICWNMIYEWILDIADPDTGVAMAGLDLGADAALTSQVLWKSSMYSAAFAAIQFDPTFRPENIIDCNICVNVMPESPGELGIQRVLGTTQTMERSVSFRALQLHNARTREVGKTLGEALLMHKQNAQALAPTFEAVLKDIADHGMAYQNRHPTV